MRIEGFEERRVRVGDVELLVREGGAGEPVLLWHGFLETGLCWRHVAADLARDFRVIVPDMRGYGGSSKPTDGYDARRLYEDFRALVPGGERIHLVAHDMGAPPALLWAGEHPDEVATVTYVEEPLATRDALAPLFAFERETQGMGGLWWWNLALAPDAAERLVAGKERAFLTWFYDHYTANRAAIGEELVDAYLESFKGPEGIAGALGVYRAIFDTIAQTEALTRVDTPTLAVGGERSLAAHVGEMLKPLCSDLRVEVVGGSGHFVPDEQPTALAGLIHEQIARKKEHADAV